MTKSGYGGLVVQELRWYFPVWSSVRQACPVFASTLYRYFFLIQVLLPDPVHCHGDQYDNKDYDKSRKEEASEGQEECAEPGACSEVIGPDESHQHGNEKKSCEQSR